MSAEKESKWGWNKKKTQLSGDMEDDVFEEETKEEVNQVPFSINRERDDSIYTREEGEDALGGGSPKKTNDFVREGENLHGLVEDDDDEDDGDNLSVLSEISNEAEYFRSKQYYQTRALLRKNITLQLR